MSELDSDHRIKKSISPRVTTYLGVIWLAVCFVISTGAFANNLAADGSRTYGHNGECRRLGQRVTGFGPAMTAYGRRTSDGLPVPYGTMN